MSLSNRKFGYGKEGANFISLYTDLKDVGGAATAFPFQADGKTLYAKIGGITHKQASGIKLSKEGVKCLLLKASTIWTLKNLNINAYPAERVTINNSGEIVSIKNKYGDDTDKTQMFFNINIPDNAKNPVLSFDWRAGGKPIVDITYGFGEYKTLLSLDGGSTQTEGSVSISLKNKSGYYWYFEVLSYSQGTYTKYFNMYNFKIEFEEY